MKLGMAIGAAVFLAVTIHAADWAATRVLWLCAVLLILGFAGFGLWHRRKLAEIHELQSDTIGHFRRVNRAVNWPKACISCGATAHDWKSVRAHGDPARSACAAHIIGQEKAEIAPESWSATVTSGGGAGTMDTLTDAPRPELEAR
jgi:hypothetical protein